VAERFASEGWFVGLFDVDEAGVLALQRQLGASNAHAGRLDVSNPSDWDMHLASFVEAAGGRLDVLVNNAGISVTSLFDQATLASHHRLIDINLKGVVNGCHHALHYLKRTPGARVINLCSASALYGQPMLSTYSATKAAVRSLTESLDIEWRRHGVRVVDVPRCIWRVARRSNWRLPVHTPVGRQTSAFYAVSKWSPEWMTRFVTARMAGF